MLRMETASIIQQLEKRRGQNTWTWLAAQIGCSGAYLSDIRAGKRNPGPKILKFLGLKQIVIYKAAVK